MGYSVHQSARPHRSSDAKPEWQTLSGGHKIRILEFFTEFSSIFLHFHLLMEVFPFVCYHPLEHIDLRFEDSSEGFLSDFAKNLGDPTF
jgi:hypothetical protein